MMRPRWLAAFILAGALLAAVSAAAQEGGGKPRETYFVGVDTSGSFRRDYDDAMSFLAWYVYGHLHGLGGLTKPREIFLAAIGGKELSEPKAFRTIHDVSGKDIARLEADFRKWYPATDALTDFNVFFSQVARVAKERNLLLSPITIVVLSDGVPDLPGWPAGSPHVYKQVDLNPLEFLSKNLTVRLTFASPKVGDAWRRYVPRQRVRFWAAEAELMRNWRNHLRAGADPAEQKRFWKWVQHNVDFRVRSRPL